MDSIHEYYDSMADISISTREAIESIELAKKNVQEALIVINRFKNQGDTAISFLSNVTANDIRRNLFFLELLLNQTHGVTNTLTFQELLGLTSYLTDDKEF
jgi:hypothetical protein